MSAHHLTNTKLCCTTWFCLQVGQIDAALCVPGLTLFAAKSKADSHMLVALQPHLQQYAQESTKTHVGLAVGAGGNGPWGALNMFPGLEEFAVLDLVSRVFLG